VREWVESGWMSARPTASFIVRGGWSCDELRQSAPGTLVPLSHSPETAFTVGLVSHCDKLYVCQGTTP